MNSSKKPAVTTNANPLREQIAAEAARIIATEGVKDYGLAKRKAAARLGNPKLKHLPQNREIEAALYRHQDTFGGNHTDQHQQALIHAAQEALDFFAPFSPRISGSLANGAITEHCVLEVHLFADPVEDIEHFLDQHDLPYHATTRRLRYTKNHYRHHPGYQFSTRGVDVLAIAFSRQDLQAAPLSHITGQPMQRLSLYALKSLP